MTIHSIKKVRLRASALLLLAAVALTGCFEQDIITYEGPAVLEMAPYTPDGQYRRNLTVAHDADASRSYNVRVQLVAPQQASPISFSLATSGDAVEGEHYTINPASGHQIDANSSFTDVTVTMLSENFAPGETASLVLTISDADAEVSENYNTFTVNMAKEEVPEEDEE